MRCVALVAVLVTMSLLVTGCAGSRVTSNDSTLADGGISPPALTHLATHEMQVGTHRPELLQSGERLFLMVVEHLQSEGKRVRHMGYVFEPDSGQVDSGFVVSYETEEYGQGADHRAVMVGDEIAVVYQSNIMDPSKEFRGGPAEQYASSQSLLLARFSADDGGELFRGPIVDKATDFEEDNFPDFCVLARGNRLLVSTGSGDGFKLREVDMEGKVLSTIEKEVSPQGVPSGIGNSMIYTEDGRLLVFSHSFKPGGGDLTVTTLDKDYDIVDSKEFYTPGRDEGFATGVISHDGYYFIGYGSREEWKGSVEEYPYSPYLMVVDADTLEVVADFKVSDRPGFGHTHATLAVHGERLYYAWSTRADGTDGRAPQVFVEEFELK